MRLSLIIISLAAFVGALLWIQNKTTKPDLEPSTHHCDIVIAGGTTAALGAALSASKEIELLQNSSKTVCLTEPTNMVGGQLTASGTPAVDFAFHTTKNEPIISSRAYSRKIENNSRDFADWMQALGKNENGQFKMPDPGREPCWVSVRCFTPDKISKLIEATLETYIKAGILKVYKNSVIKKLVKKGRLIYSVQIIKRTRTETEYPSPFHERLSQTINDWYSPLDSKYYTKQLIDLSARQAESPILSLVEATEWGEVLTLSRAPYLQGREKTEKKPSDVEDLCGQAITNPIALEIKKETSPLPQWANNVRQELKGKVPYSLNDISGQKFTWDEVWTYRRLILNNVKGKLGRFDIPVAGFGDVSMQNWTAGNDYLEKYIFLHPQKAKQQTNNWFGGINIAALDKSERRALGWMLFLRQNAPQKFAKKIVPSAILGHKTGLSLVPYIRDTKRSVAINNFTLKYETHLKKGYQFKDTVAIGVYAADIHELESSECAKQPQHIKAIKGGDAYPPPFYLPLRSHTNKGIDNLLVAGKSISQTFAANSATRLHPIEFSSGVAAGVSAAMMIRNNYSTADLLKKKVTIAIQKRISDVDEDGRPRHGPIEWTKPND